MESSDFSVFTPRLILGNGQVCRDAKLVFRRDKLVKWVENESVKNCTFAIDGWITPGWINAHCHLELSHLKGAIPRGTEMDGFVSAIQQKRSEIPFSSTAVKEQMDQMYERGTVLVGDICNGPETADVKADHPLETHNFIELIGANPDRANAVLANAERVAEAFPEAHRSLAPHAPYSVSDQLIEKINRSNSREKKTSTIHYMESRGERELYEHHRGPLKEQLKKFGLSDAMMRTGGIPAPDQLINSEAPVIWVHNTYLTGADFDRADLNRNHWFWCTCPKANLYIENRLPDYALWMKNSLQIVIGTDSLASNDQLDLLDEMRTIQLHHPEISTETMIQWVTGNAARAFQRTDLGTIQEGLPVDRFTCIDGLDERGRIRAGSSTRKLVQEIGIR